MFFLNALHRLLASVTSPLLSFFSPHHIAPIEQDIQKLSSSFNIVVPSRSPRLAVVEGGKKRKKCLCFSCFYINQKSGAAAFRYQPLSCTISSKRKRKKKAHFSNSSEFIIIIIIIGRGQNYFYTFFYTQLFLRSVVLSFISFLVLELS